MHYLNHAILRVTLIIAGIALLLIAAFQIFYNDEPAPTGKQPTSGQLNIVQTADGKPELRQCLVIKVYDGDSIGCDFNEDGKITNDSEKIRLLGIEAPEMHYSKKLKKRHLPEQDQPFALKAKQYITEQVMKQSVFVETDVKQQDRYQRTLAYVYLDPHRDMMLNEMLVSRGLAKCFFIEPNHRYNDMLTQSEKDAKSEHLGLWDKAH